MNSDGVTADRLPCGHPLTAVVNADEGTSYCGMCTDLSRQEKGSKDNPLSLLDLPFTVPKAGRYWLTYGDSEPMQLPHASKGSVLDVESRP